MAQKIHLPPAGEARRGNNEVETLGRRTLGGREGSLWGEVEAPMATTTEALKKGQHAHDNPTEA